jgi:hypothetical protein
MIADNEPLTTNSNNSSNKEDIDRIYDLWEDTVWTIVNGSYPILKAFKDDLVWINSTYQENYDSVKLKIDTPNINKKVDDTISKTGGIVINIKTTGKINIFS